MPAYRKTNLKGQTFGRWFVLGENIKARLEKQRTSKAIIPTMWSCICECGTERPAIRVHALLSGKSTSCGCIGKEQREAKRNEKQRVKETQNNWI